MSEWHSFFSFNPVVLSGIILIARDIQLFAIFHVYWQWISPRYNKKHNESFGSPDSVPDSCLEWRKITRWRALVALVDSEHTGNNATKITRRRAFVVLVNSKRTGSNTTKVTRRCALVALVNSEYTGSFPHNYSYSLTISVDDYWKSIQ